MQTATHPRPGFEETRAPLRACSSRVSDPSVVSTSTPSARWSARLSALVAALFATAELPLGNALSDANRAVDHVFADGPAARDTRMRIASGDTLPEVFVASLGAMLPGAGYDTARGDLAG
ncbi:MAG: hypothetical protein AAFV86_12695 [Pseudomonadota bacterium]